MEEGGAQAPRLLPAPRWGLRVAFGFSFQSNQTNLNSKGAISSGKDGAGGNPVAWDGGDTAGTSSPRRYLAGCCQPPVLINPSGFWSPHMVWRVSGWLWGGPHVWLEGARSL